METPVEIRYAGVVVARAETIRRTDTGGVDMFVPMPEPLPAGTLVRVGDEGQARIEKVIESTDASMAGVYLRLIDAQEAARPWTPAFKEQELPPLPAPERLPVVVAANTAEPIAALRADGRHVTVAMNSAPTAENDGEHPRQTIVIAVAPPAETRSEPKVDPVPKVKIAEESNARQPPIVSVAPPPPVVGGASAPTSIIVDQEAVSGESEIADKPTVPTRVGASPDEDESESESESGAVPVDELPPARPLPNDARRRSRTRRKTNQR